MKKNMLGSSMKQFRKFAVTLCLTMASVPLAANANGYVAAPVTPPPVVSQEAQTIRAFPGIFGAASAIAPSGGSGYVALTYANPRGGISGNNADGDLAFGYTVGNPIDAVSLSFGVNVTGLDPFGDSGSVFASAARLLRAGGNSATFVGLSAGNLLGWGDAEGSDESFSGYVSHLVAFPMAGGELPAQFTFGYGNRTTYDADVVGQLDEGFFVGAGVGVTETLSLSASATATQLNLGASLTVPQVPGLGISAGIYDVTENVDRQQFTLSVAFGF